MLFTVFRMSASYDDKICFDPYTVYGLSVTYIGGYAFDPLSITGVAVSIITCLCSIYRYKTTERHKRYQDLFCGCKDVVCSPIFH